MTPDKIWTVHDSVEAQNEGWDMFAALHVKGDVEVFEIEGDDDTGEFKDDAEAVLFVMKQALKGNKLAIKALFLHGHPVNFDVDTLPLALLV